MKKKILTTLVLLPILVFFTACFNNDQGSIFYNLWIDVQGDGFVNPCHGQYPLGTTLTFDLRPGPGSVFSNWEGNSRYEVQQNPNGQWQLTINGDKNLIAIFVKQGDTNPNPDPEPVKYNLNIQFEGRGLVNPNSGSFNQGEALYLEVWPEEGWIFSSWQGANKDDVISTVGRWAIIMDSHKNLLAVFKEANYNLDIEILGKGSVEERIISGEYAKGTQVRLWAKAERGWQFQEWQGDVGGTDVITKLVLDSDKYVRAVFSKEKLYYELTVDKIGQGRVEEQVVSSEYAENDIVRLTAIASSGWRFSQWRGDLQTRRSVVELEMDSDKTVIAVFVKENEDDEDEDELEYCTLQITIMGEGQVSKEPDLTKYPLDTLVTLIATPAKGWIFKGWSRDASGTNPRTKLTMTRDMEVVASFEEDGAGYKLEININGQGIVNKEPDKREYEWGTPVTLSATPAEGWEFRGWSGDISDGNNQTIVTMDENKYVSATFTERPNGYILTTIVGGGEGTISRDPDFPFYEANCEVTLRGVCEPGWRVNYWLCEGQSYQGQGLVVIMRRDLEVTAFFARGDG